MTNDEGAGGEFYPEIGKKNHKKKKNGHGLGIGVTYVEYVFNTWGSWAR